MELPNDYLLNDTRCNQCLALEIQYKQEMESIPEELKMERYVWIYGKEYVEYMFPSVYP